MCVCVCPLLSLPVWLCEAGHGPDMAGRLALVGVCVSEATGSPQARKCNHAEQLCQNSSPSNQGAGMREREREGEGRRGGRKEREEEREGEREGERERERESLAEVSGNLESWNLM